MVDFMLRNRRNTYHWREIIRIFVVILFDVSDYIFTTITPIAIL